MKDKDYELIKGSNFFDAKWYKKQYKVKGDPYLHYLNEGYKLGYNPSSKFSRIKYELIYEDVRYVKANPLLHYEKYGCYEPNFTDEIYVCNKELKEINEVKKAQDRRIKYDYNSNEENLVVFLVPEFDMINGGVMSINTIAKVTKQFEDIHHSKVILCTMPNPKTFDKYTKFESDFNIYRFDQFLTYFKKIQRLIIHIPEIYVQPFLYYLTPDQEIWLRNIKYTQINILNQNVDLMPRPRLIEYLKDMSSKVTMTIAHKKYCVPQFRTSYGIDVHFLSTSNLIKYEYNPYKNKDNILLYSPDCHPMKKAILDNISKSFPDLEMIEIKGLKYKDYLKLISKAKWMITFGEGLDGYFLESSRSGTMAFSIFNTEFFDGAYENLDNLFIDYNDMQDNIVKKMKMFDNEKKYNKIVKKCIDIDKVQYDDDNYIRNIKNYYLENYTYPIDSLNTKRMERMNSNPLVSIALASYNGEKFIKKQIDSLLNQTYKNIEIVVSDDGSTDATLEILKKYKNKIKIINNTGNHGLVPNFINAIKNCKGEYLALSDQDDIWEPNKIERLLFQIDDFDIIQSGVCIIDKNDSYYPQKYMHDEYEIDKTRLYKIQNYISTNYMLGCTTLMNMEFVKANINIPNECMYHDYWFVLQAILNGKGIVYIDEQLIKYRQHGNNTAFLTYNSNDWADKKILFDKYMIKNMKFDPIIKNLFQIDINYNIINDSLSKFLPEDSYAYCKKNYSKLDNVTLKKIIESINEKFKKYL